VRHAPIVPAPKDHGAIGPRRAAALAAYEASLGRRLTAAELLAVRAAAYAAAPVGRYPRRRD
jgi:hypothetical protein